MYNKANKQHQPEQKPRGLLGPVLQFCSQPQGALLAPGRAGAVLIPPGQQGALWHGGSAAFLPHAAMAGRLQQECRSGGWEGGDEQNAE